MANTSATAQYILINLIELAVFDVSAILAGNMYTLRPTYLEYKLIIKQNNQINISDIIL